MKNNMKKIAKLMTVLAIAAFTFTSCEDVPSPFGTVTPPTTDVDDGNTELPYNSVNLNSGWTLEAITADQPWSQGSSYVQATGYQKWDGAESKTNRAVKGWLVSPAFSTKGYENVKIFFEQTIKYTSYTGWEANHKVFVTNNYDESNFSATTWVEITDFKPVASPYESKDWTLYSSGELQLPASMTGQEAIHIGFYFEAPADKSTTWELKNFNIVEGIADNPGGGDTPTPTGDTDGSEAKPYTIVDAVAAGSGTEKYVKAYIVGWVEGQVLSEGAHFNGNATSNSNILIADSPDETDVTKCMPVQLPSGAVRTAVNLKDNPDNYKKEVLLNGNIEKYFGATGIKSTGYAKIGDKEAGTKPGGGDTPSGGGDTPVYSMDFKTAGGLGTWTIDTKSKDPALTTEVWTFDSRYGMKASAFANSTSYASEAWLVSPAIDLTNAKGTLNVHHALNKHKDIETSKQQSIILASSDGGSTWTELTVSNWPTSLSWTFVDSSADISAFKGKNNIKIAFKYLSSTESAGTWEIEKLTIE